MEQRKKHLAEKENKEKERIRRFEEKKKQDLEKRKRYKFHIERILFAAEGTDFLFWFL